MTLLDNGQIRAEISAQGAELRSLQRVADGREWLWQGDAAWWTGRAPLLFPIVGQCPDGAVEIAGESFAMRSHGFARHAEFAQTAQSATAVEFTLAPNAQTRAEFPFDFRLIVRYALQESALLVTARVENHDRREMPFQFGFHPAFVWPLPGAEDQRHQLRFLDNVPQDMRRLRGGLMDPTPLTPPLVGDAIIMNPEDYRADAMVFPDLNAQGFVFEGGAASVTMRVKGLPDFALWQKPGAPFLCLEPWHGMAPYPALGPALAARPNAIVLAPGAVQSFEMEIALKAAA